MYWRLGGAYREAPPGANREALRQIVKRGSPPGLLAFDGDLPVGWCQLTPRNALPWPDHRWWFSREDAVPWSISCFFVRRGYRRQGAMTQLIPAALKTAKRARAPALEGYPIDTSAPNSIEYLYRYRRLRSHARDSRWSLAAHRLARHAPRSEGNRAMKLLDAAPMPVNSASRIGDPVPGRFAMDGGF